MAIGADFCGTGGALFAAITGTAGAGDFTAGTGVDITADAAGFAGAVAFATGLPIGKLGAADFGLAAGGVAAALFNGDCRCTHCGSTNLGGLGTNVGASSRSVSGRLTPRAT